MRVEELARSRTMLAEGLEKLSVLVEFRDTVVARGSAGVTLGDEDIAIGRDQNVGGLVEFARGRGNDSCLPESHQYLSIRGKLEYLVTLAVLDLRIGDPQ